MTFSLAGTGALESSSAGRRSTLNAPGDALALAANGDSLYVGICRNGQRIGGENSCPNSSSAPHRRLNGRLRPRRINEPEVEVIPMSNQPGHAEYERRKYLPELDGLRAISVLLVVSVHLHDFETVWKWLAGWQGVTVFFVLSGYLITTLSLREEGQRGAVSLAAFYVRRSLRIFPLYYLTLAAYCGLIFGLGLNPEKHFLLTGAMPYYLLYFQEVPFFYGLPGESGVIQHANIPFYQSWSLGIEEKFYLVWPLLAFVLWRGRTALRLKGTTALVIALALVPPLFALARRESVAAVLFPYYPILAGCLLALLLHDRVWFDRLRFLGRRAWTTTTLALFIALHLLRPRIPVDSPSLAYLCDVAYTIAVSLFITSVLMGEGRVQQVLRWQPLVSIGRLSYGIYLVHILCLNIAQKVFPPHSGRVVVSIGAYVLTFTISVAVAWLLAAAVEKPCIEIGRRWSKRILEESHREDVVGSTVQC
jgi:peptidoglycan/LPS O-acetylase OafA/YrhL